MTLRRSLIELSLQVTVLLGHPIESLFQLVDLLREVLHRAF
jgi:hypothetical protein